MMRKRPVLLFLLLAVNSLTGKQLVPVILTTKLMLRSRLHKPLFFVPCRKYKRMSDMTK